MSSRTGAEERAFLTNITSLDSHLEHSEPHHHHHEQRRQKRLIEKCSRGEVTIFVILQFVLIFLYTAIYHISLASCVQSTTKTGGVQPGKSPRDIAGLDVQWQTRKFTKNQDSPFIGPPSALTELAWDHLLENMTIRVTKEELERAGKDSVALPEGGFMAWLGVYHELHCIKYLRKWAYKEHYFPGVSTDEEIHHRTAHADHCIEMLRSAAICRADTSLTTFHWETQVKPMLDLRRVIHTCVDWERLKDSVSHRIVSLEESSRLRNPNSQITS